MSQEIELYTEKVAAAQRRLVVAQARLGHANPAETAAIEREIAVIQAMLPLLSKFVDFLKLLEE